MAEAHAALINITSASKPAQASLLHILLPNRRSPGCGFLWQPLMGHELHACSRSPTPASSRHVCARTAAQVVCAYACITLVTLTGMPTQLAAGLRRNDARLLMSSRRQHQHVPHCQSETDNRWMMQCSAAAHITWHRVGCTCSADCNSQNSCRCPRLHTPLLLLLRIASVIMSACTSWQCNQHIMGSMPGTAQQAAGPIQLNHVFHHRVPWEN